MRLEPSAAQLRFWWSKPTNDAMPRDLQQLAHRARVARDGGGEGEHRPVSFRATAAAVALSRAARVPVQSLDEDQKTSSYERACAAFVGSPPGRIPDFRNSYEWES
jgi:hypothetical protein